QTALRLLQVPGYQLYNQQADPRHMRVLLAQHGARSAVLAHGPDLLPQSPHLSQQGAAGTRDPDLPLRAQAAWVLVPWHVREHLPARRSVYLARQEEPRIPATR